VTTRAAAFRRAALSAADSIEPMTIATREIAARFRRRELGRAQADLGDLFRTLRTLTVITSRLASPVERGTDGPAAIYAGLMRTLDEFARRQRAEDWDGVASLLTDDLERVLAEWPATLRTFANRAFGVETPRPTDLGGPEARS
jgi:hypothetical protein